MEPVPKEEEGLFRAKAVNEVDAEQEEREEGGG